VKKEKNLNTAGFAELFKTIALKNPDKQKLIMTIQLSNGRETRSR